MYNFKALAAQDARTEGGKSLKNSMQRRGIVVKAFIGLLIVGLLNLTVVGTFSNVAFAQGAQVHLQIYSLGGKPLAEYRTYGSSRTLSFQVLDYHGRPLANGVYLAVVTTRDAFGNLKREVQKILVLRGRARVQLSPSTVATRLGLGTVSAASASLSVEEAIARLVPNDPAGVANPDVVIGTEEYMKAVDLWIQQEPVPGTNGEKIDDAMFTKLTDLWVSGEPVTNWSSAVKFVPQVVAALTEKMGQAIKQLNSSVSGMSTNSSSDEQALKTLRESAIALVRHLDQSGAIDQMEQQAQSILSEMLRLSREERLSGYRQLEADLRALGYPEEDIQRIIQIAKDYEVYVTQVIQQEGFRALIYQSLEAITGDSVQGQAIPIVAYCAAGAAAWGAATLYTIGKHAGWWRGHWALDIAGFVAGGIGAHVAGVCWAPFAWISKLPPGAL